MSIASRFAVSSLVLTVVAWSGSLVFGGAPPVGETGRAMGPIRLDGVANEGPWQSASWHTHFLKAGGMKGEADALKPADVQTRFKVLLDEQAVYVAVECDEPSIEKIKAKTPWRDGAVWSDDCVEIFFDPSGEGRYYHQVMVNSRGTIYDSYSADYGLVHSRLWNGAFRAAGHVDREGKKWSVEVEIPYGAVVLGGDAGSTWLWNVARERHAGGSLELTSWSPVKANFHQPKCFGRLTGLPADYRAFRFRFEEPRVAVSRAASGIATLGLTLSAHNETGSDRRVVAMASVLEDGRISVKTEPVVAAKGRETTFEFPALRSRRSTTRTNVVFAIRDAESNRLLKAVVKSLSSEYRPITVRVLQPCYRNNIYATEDLGEIVFEVGLSAQVRQASERVEYSLNGEEDQILAKGQAPVSSIGKPVCVPVPDLPVGTYTLAVAAIDADGAQQAATETVLRKLPPPPAGNEVRIDEDRNVLINGKPFFAIGWYGSVPTHDPRKDVVALQNVRTPQVINPPDASPIRDAFDGHGVYTVASVENGRLKFSFKLWQERNKALRHVTQEQHQLTEPSDDMKGLVKELVDCVRGEPGLLGYYIADEPEIHDIPSAYLENYYKYLCEIDPYHPVFVTNDTLDGIVTHGYKCADVLDPDPYRPTWDYVPNFLKKVNEVASHGKATYVTQWHSSTQAHFTKEYGTAPPYPFRVLRNQYFASICYGTKGFTPYTSPFFMNEIEYRFGIPHVWRELRFLEQAILSPAPAASVTVEGAPGMATWAREVGGRVYLILVNHKSEGYDATVRWEGLGRREELFVMSEGRSVAVRDGAFRDRFEEGDVHIYTDDPEAQRFPTVQAVMDELARRHKEAVKPGNLLHWTRGTKVRCSKGYYAPWFHQFYYYAINGLTDDTGWSAYAWQKKPAWIELTLKEPADVGRIVIYTPNLRDYQLDLSSAGGEVHRAQVKGNEQAVVEHSFRPSVPCLKIRLTVTAIRPCDVPHGSAPLVPEIEAYRDAGAGPVTPVAKLAAKKSTVQPFFADDKAPNALWVEDFAPLETAPKYYWQGKDTKWVLSASKLRAEARPEGGLSLCSISPTGGSGMTHFFPYDPAYRFLQHRFSQAPVT